MHLARLALAGALLAGAAHAQGVTLADVPHMPLPGSAPELTPLERALQHQVHDVTMAESRALAAGYALQDHVAELDRELSSQAAELAELRQVRDALVATLGQALGELQGAASGAACRQSGNTLQPAKPGQ